MMIAVPKHSKSHHTSSPPLHYDQIRLCIHHWLLLVGGDDFLFHKTKSTANDKRRPRDPQAPPKKMTTLAMIPTNSTKDQRRCLLLPRLLPLLLLLLSLLPTPCRSFECFAASDGYVYPGSGTPTVDVDSVLGKAVRAYLNPNTTISQAVQAKYGTNINDWCVGDVVAMDSIFYYLSSFNEEIGNWNVSSVTTMRGRGSHKTNVLATLL
jgi:surface protein